MARSTSGSGLISPFAVGQEGNDFATIFDAGSTDNVSHVITVDNNFIRVVAYNLSVGEVITIQQVTGTGATELAADYCPVSGPVTLFFNSTTDQRTSYVLERPGKYRFVLTGGGLGLVTCRAYQFFVENEASQDIADALFAVLNQPPSPCRIGNAIPLGTAENLVVGKDLSGCLDSFQLVSSVAGNNIALFPDGVYSSGGAIPPTPCSLGGIILPGAVSNNVVGKDGNGCLIDFPLLSTDAGNSTVQHPNGLFTPQGILGAAPTATTNPTIIGNTLYEDVKLSATAGNLLQINPDGLYYGILPPANFVNQYVSSSTGNDANPGTIAAPLKTIQKALSNLPDGTHGNIFLLAGDTFHTYPTAVTDVINTLTFVQSLQQKIAIGNRDIAFRPYNDPILDAVNTYNVVHGSNIYPYNCAQINFPTIKFTLSLPTDIPTAYIPIYFELGTAGNITLFAINLDVGQTGTVNPVYDFGCFEGGTVNIQGGNIKVGSVPLLGGPNDTIFQTTSLRFVQIADHATPSTPPLFSNLSGSHILNTFASQVGGVQLNPQPPWVLGNLTNGDNVETFLTPAALWPGIVIYSTAFRSFRNLTTSIAIA